MMGLQNFYLYLTWKCNLFCRHCWVDANNDDAIRLDNNVIINACKKAVDLGAHFIKISGGEPLLFKNDIIMIANILKKYNSKTYLHLETNATLINDKDAEELKIFNSISVSLDSANPDEHNYIRGSSNAHYETISGIEKMIKNGIDVSVTSVISDPNNIDSHIREMIVLLNNLGVKKLKLNPIMKNGRARNNQDSFYNIDPIEMIDIQSRYIDEKEVQVVIMLPCAYNLNLLDTAKSKFHTCDCLSLLSLLPNGDVGLCGEARKAPELIFGNIINEDLTNIWNSSINLRALRDVIPENMEGVCKKCAINKICKGGCRVDGYLSGGSIASSSSICQTMHERGLFHLTKNER